MWSVDRTTRKTKKNEKNSRFFAVYRAHHANDANDDEMLRLRNVVNSKIHWSSILIKNENENENDNLICDAYVSLLVLTRFQLFRSFTDGRITAHQSLPRVKLDWCINFRPRN